MKRITVPTKLVRGATAGIGLAFLVFLFLGAKDPSSAQAGLQTLREMQDAFHAVAAKVIPTVVEIHVVDITQGPANNFNPFDFGNNNNNPPRTRQYRQAALGSGVIIDRRGDTVYVLTNNHVAGSASTIQVQLSDNRQFPAKLVGKDENKDLALVSFATKESVPVAELGDSDNVQVGDWVLAVGNPLGFTGTVTAGIVSAVGRNSTDAGGAGGAASSFTDYIQTDAAINQGNSGGALVNIEGQVVGLNTWIASPSGGNVGLGFSIPINNAKKDIGDFISKGKVEYGWLGVTIGDASPAMAKEMNLGGAGGALVSGLFPNGPAARAGLLPGDYVTSLNGTAVKNTAQLLQLIGNLAPGKAAALALVRNGKPATLTATLGTRSDEQTLSAQSNSLWPGFAIESLSPEVRSTLNLANNLTGVVVVNTQQNGYGDKAGLQSGDVITQVGGGRVAGAADFFRNLNASSGNNIEIRLTRDSSSITLTLSK